MENLHERIAYYRKRKGLTQTDVASQMGLQRQNYRKYEIGERVPSREKLVQIADILGVSCLALQYGAEQLYLSKLNRILRGMALGEWKDLAVLLDDLSEVDLVNQPIQATLVKWSEIIAGKHPEFWREYVQELSVKKLVSLVAHVKKSEKAWQTRQPYQVADMMQDIKEDIRGKTSVYHGVEYVQILPERFEYENADLPVFILLRLAYCYAVLTYTMDTPIHDIIKDMVAEYGVEDQEDAGLDARDEEEMSDEDCERATILFAIKIYIPFLKIMIETLERISENGSMDDFERVLINRMI